MVDTRELDVVVERVVDAPARTGVRKTAVAGAGIVALALVAAALALPPIAVLVILGLGGITPEARPPQSRLRESRRRSYTHALFRISPTPPAPGTMYW